MNTIIRTHIKNEERYDLLLKSIDSYYDVKLNEIGSLTIVDDHSQNGYDHTIRKMCDRDGFTYVKSGYDADTKNGLYWSLKQAKENENILCCVDDLVFSKHIVDIIYYLENEILSLKLQNKKWATFGMFACYPFRVRSLYNNIPDVWNIATTALYALVCHIFNYEFSQILIKTYEDWKNNLLTKEQEQILQCCDDIWVARSANLYNYKCFNTVFDYAQHTGMLKRSFQNDSIGNSDYRTECFKI